MATISAPQPTSAPSQSDQQLVVFSLHDEHYALPITSVREIIRYQQPRRVGQINSVMQGVISVRGRILPVCDISPRLGKVPTVRDGAKILIVETSDTVIGLVVDAVDEVLLVDAEQIEPLPVGGGRNRFGHQIAKVDERLIILLDAERDFAGVLAA